MGTNDTVRQMQTLDYVNRTDRWGEHMYQNVDTREDDGLWISVQDNYIDTGQRQDCNHYE